MSDTHWSIDNDSFESSYGSEYLDTCASLSEPINGGSNIRLAWDPGQRRATVTGHGHMDANAARRLAEILARHLSGTLHTLVVDISRVDTVEPLTKVLRQARLLARHRGVTLYVVT